MKVLDLCSGIGGFRLGLNLSNYNESKVEFTCFSEIDKYATEGYKSMYGSKNEIELGDIQLHTRFPEELAHEGVLPTKKQRASLINERIPDIDMLFAGFPCQPHSLMGNRKGTQDSRGNLFYDISEVLKVKEPEYFVLENVKSLKSVNNGAFYEEIIHVLTKQLKYNVKVFVLNASDFGIPQTRRRIFFVGSKSRDISNISIDNYIMSLKDAKYQSTWHLLEKEVDEKYFLSDRILKTILKDQHKGYSRKAEINKLIARPVTKTMHKMHRASQDNYYSEAFINKKAYP
jgi:DNA (cytosine-5)-methyltransferase 1